MKARIYHCLSPFKWLQSPKQKWFTMATPGRFLCFNIDHLKNLHIDEHQMKRSSVWKSYTAALVLSKKKYPMKMKINQPWYEFPILQVDQCSWLDLLKSQQHNHLPENSCYFPSQILSHCCSRHHHYLKWLNINNF